MSAFDELKKKHPQGSGKATPPLEWVLIQASENDDIGFVEEAAAELAALRDAKLIATHLLIDIQTFFNSEVKVCNGIGCEFELGMLDSISAFLDLHGTDGNIKGDA